MEIFINVYQKANQLTGGLLDILKNALQSFSQHRGTQGAAGLAYYTLFSLFPLLIVIVSLASFWLGGEQAITQAVDFISEGLPVSRNLIETNLERVLDLRGPAGIISIVLSLWSASLVFATLANNINLAWEKSESRNMIKNRFVGVVMIAFLVLVLFLSIFLSTFARLLPSLNIPILEDIPIINTSLWNIGFIVLPWIVVFLLFFSLYFWVPNTNVELKAAIWAALFASIVWEGLKVGFTWYLGSGLASYEVVYGSLSTVVVLMFWIYLSGVVILFGAHLCASIDKASR